MKVLILLFLSLTGFGQELKEQDLKTRLKNFENTVKERFGKMGRVEPPQLDEKRKNELKAQVEELKKKAEQEKTRFKYDDGKIVVGERKEVDRQERADVKIKLAGDERIYILMSSSVPKGVWKTYAKAIENYGISDKAFLVLRGCIGGCTYIKPTLSFIQSIISPSEKEQIKAEVWIDPLVFRRFGIQRVPCFVYVKGDILENSQLSIGLPENLKTKGKEYISCGDWAFEYHMQEFCKKGVNSLCKIASQDIVRRGQQK